ncbi:ATP-binding protein [Aquimarina sp. 2201CG14-23]|uniref:ATP-binding protein n=1 Tax=Aquimarina mycalae TaxID=3040073 RepID=UPI0024781EFE|nr:ATP-binding protein [Aquimarina sp. 2201CG14-23]MDH7446893.1 histidine kinase [Aquimarina sp. 2201CG14-23]
MLKKIIPLILGLALNVISFAQEREHINSLIKQVKDIHNENQKLLLLDSLSKEIYAIIDDDFEFYQKEYPTYCFDYINLAKKLEDYDKASKKTARLSNHYLQIIGKPDSALIIINNALKDSIRIKKPFNLGQLYLKRAGAYYQIDNLAIAIKDYDRAKGLFHQSKDSIYEADATFFSGQSSERLGNLTEALLKYQESQKLYNKMKDTAYVAYTGLAVSGIYSQLYLLDLSFDERKKIRDMLTNNERIDYNVLSELSINDARDFIKKKEYKKEEIALLKALRLSKKVGNNFAQIFRARAYVGEFYAKQDNIELARKHIDTLELSTALINGPYDRIFYLKSLGRLKVAEGNYNEAIQIFNEEIDIFKKSGDIRAQVHLEKELYRANKSLNNYKQATIHLDRHLKLKDSVYNITRSNSVIYYQTLYETEKRDNQIALQKVNISALEIKNKGKRNLLIFGGIGLSLLFLVIYLYRNKTLLLRNKRLQQSFLQELLQTQERLSKRISKDLHDSVGQSLLLIKNKLIQKEDIKTAEVVDEVIDEVREISRNLHPFKLEEMGLTVTLQSSVEMIDENYDIFISAEIEDIDQVFDQEQEINIYRLVQESFNNILKHSNANSAEIIVHNKANNVEIVIKDNGKGFDITKEKLSVSKIGLKTLSERSNFLKASFKILSEINKGTTLIFNIPKYEQA